MSGSLPTTHPTNGVWATVRVEDLQAKARDENFPVASRLLPRRQRAHLLALYAFARLVDDVGDEFEGDRLAALNALDSELTRAFSGEATHPVFVRLQPSIRECRLVEAPFRNLIEANRRDQSIASYATFDDLVGYCTLSANPVGRLVLRVFDADTPPRVAWSDDVCTALQIVEHLQDVGEDARRGRVYLPIEDQEAEGCTVEDLTAAVASSALRRTVAQESARARGLLDSASPLLRFPLRATSPGHRGLRRRWSCRPRCDRRSRLRRSRSPLPAASAAVARTCAAASSGPAPWGERMNLETAYARCEEITRTEAKNFSYGIRLLAPPQRKAMSALYALARRIDDIGDGDDAVDDKLAALSSVREKVHMLQSDARRVSDDPIYCALAHASTRFPIPLDAFNDLIDGVEQDCRGTFYDEADDTIAYCRLVAGSGRAALAGRVRLF